MSSDNLHLELLEKYDVYLDSDGKVYNKSDDGEYARNQFFIGYRDDGPDAWANSQWFSGPAWVWDSSEGWEFWKDGVTITGYNGLDVIVVYIEHNQLCVAECFGTEY